MERRAIAIQGVVQGVGFRPFVYGIARRLGLGGFVRNEVGNVLVEIEGDRGRVEQFLHELRTRPPPLARIDRIDWRPQPPRGQRLFEIEPSAAGTSDQVHVCPDIAACDDCVRELFDPHNRRFRYPFINCTNCGPRLSIVQGAPYDRQRTTMAGFTMCPACRREYEDPLDRRFHAQPTACPACGPRLALLDALGRAAPCDDPLAGLVAALKAGQIAAIKGLGGYHLACDASNARAVAELRRRKHRDEKPLAVMANDITAIEELCHVCDAERRLLTSPQRPIVLLSKRSDLPLAEQIAPGNPMLGVMLPYTPLHHLLMHDMGGRVLVMTSANRSDEPIAYADADAVHRLAGIADVFLAHDRPIHVRCDDSVTRLSGGEESPVRRSRGYAPLPISIPLECPHPMLAVGGQLKNTFALGRGRQAILSHHVGDLDHLRALDAFERDIRLFEDLFAVAPRRLVHDLHPDYASTRYAKRRSESSGIPCLAVQHHHAHMASCLAEHGVEGPAIGVSFDGTGYGTDGAVWGGEFLIGDFRRFHRAAHLRYVAMPGGEQAIRQPWRMALAHLRDAGMECPESIVRRVSAASVRTVQTMLDRRFNSPLTSSVGRLFDAVACLAGGRDRVSFEGQAAMELEWMAASSPIDSSYPFEIQPAPPPRGDEPPDAMTIDTRPLIRGVAQDAAARTPASVIARRFHTTLEEIILAVCGRIRKQTGLDRVALSGGVFMNALLASRALLRLEGVGFTVYRHRLVPPNDGGLSLGQIAVAAAQLAEHGAPAQQLSMAAND